MKKESTAVPHSSTQTREEATKLALIGLFWTLLAAVAPRVRKEEQPLNLSWLDFIMLCFATFRIGRLASYDVVTQPIREPFTETVEDDTGAGMTTAPQGSGPRRVIGQLIACPTCVGTWAAAMMVYGLRILPGPTRLFLAMTSAAGATELLNDAVESLHWTAQSKREEVGAK